MLQYTKHSVEEDKTVQVEVDVYDDVYQCKTDFPYHALDTIRLRR
jgi:hypothetical protein